MKKLLLLILLISSLHSDAWEVTIKDNIPGVSLRYVCIDTYVFVYSIFNHEPTGLTQVFISAQGSRESIVPQPRRCVEN